MTTEAKEKKPIHEARETLILLSQEVKDLVEMGQFFTINDAIMETMYKTKEHREFKAYRQWKDEGKQVRKGEKAFLLWATPKDIKRRKEETNQETEEESFQYFPICYLFSNAQVEEMQKNDAVAA